MKEKSKVRSKKVVLYIGLILFVLIIIGSIASNKIKEKMVVVNQKTVQPYETNSVEDTSVESTNGEVSKSVETAVLTDDSAIVTSASIVQRKTGTGPFDTEEGNGNDLSADDNIVRSFDQVTWTIEVNMAVNSGEYGSEDAKRYSSFKGGYINIEAKLPENCKGLMHWDTDAMSWSDGTGITSEDGLTFTAKYKMDETVITVPGKQTLTPILKVDGATNGLEINPSFKIWMDGNETEEMKDGYEATKIETVSDPVIVTSKAGYNIKLIQNTRCQNKAILDFGEGEVTGRVYGYGILLQLYGMNEEKGIKGLEYPKGDITFDINTKLEALEKIDGENITTDITEKATPLLWNYRINANGGGNTYKNPDYGNITNRNMYFKPMTAYNNTIMPYGEKWTTYRENSIYNSGNITMIQDGSVLHTTINDYGFDGIFPKYNNYSIASTPTYGENIGCFSSAYFQIFVPDNEETLKNRTYYLTVSDSNMKTITASGIESNTQVKTNDDNLKVVHYVTRPGGYSHHIYFKDDNGKWPNNDNFVNTQLGKVRKTKGQTIQANIYIDQDSTNDIGTEIRSVNKLVKFDGEGFEPILQTDGEKIKAVTNNMTWKTWYLTKKDGTSWINQEERNAANIEDLERYENLEDIPNNKICIGMYFESQGGILPIPDGYDRQYISIRFKIRETSQVGQTYGITQSSDYWTEELDRSIQTIENPDATYPKTVMSKHNDGYIKTEYDEYGQVIKGTHYGGNFSGYNYGNTVLVVGAESSISTTVTDISSGEPKKNYDLSRNENEVNLKVSPVLAELDSNMPTGITGVTVKVKDILPNGLTYVPGSSSYGEPNIEIGVNGESTLIWEIYNCAVGQEIEPITFKAKIDENTVNGTTYVNKVIIEPEKDKIGLSSIEYRTATYSFQVTNLASHRLYKEVDTPIIEKDGIIKYTLTYANITDSNMPDFQLLDILPYNGDGRGSSYNGTYTIDHIDVTQTSNNVEVESSDLKLYTTTKVEARKITPKDEGIGVNEIWNERQIGANLNEAVTVIALKGEIAPNTSVVMDIYLKTRDNRPEDIYQNSATAQTSKETEVIQTTNVKSQVVEREIKGRIWYDINENGIKDDEEEWANRIEVLLKKADGTRATDINGNEITNILTDSNGEYSFINLPKEDYKIEILPESKYRLTEANIGTNKEINSKFEEVEGKKESYEITSLNSIQSPILIERNVNAGLIVKDATITVRYLEDSTGLEIADSENITGKKIGDSYKTISKEISDYIMIRDSQNTTGICTEEPIEVIYYYKYNKQNITVNKIWNDNNDQAKKRPSQIKIQLKNGTQIVQEQILTQANKVDENTNTWSYTFENLPVYDSKATEIKYSIDEQEVNSGDLESYIKTINEKTITNTFSQNTEKTSITVIKRWEDEDNKAGKRPENLILVLKKQNGTIEENNLQEVSRQVINAMDNQGEDSNTWSYTFSNIAKYDENNNEITYVVEEEESSKGDLKFYTKNIGNVENNTVLITNTFEVPAETIDIQVAKIWEDNNNKAQKRPIQVTLVLTGNNVEYETTLTEQDQEISTSNSEGNETEVKNANKWVKTIENLPKYDENANEINYTLTERELNSIFYTKENSTINQQTKTITNKFQVPEDKIEIELSKKWNDNNNEKGVRPQDVTLMITGNNKEYTLILSSENKKADDESVWKGKITNLPKYDINGNEIEYILDEKPVTSEFYKKTEIDQQERIVTNTYLLPTESVQVGINKIWEDNNNEKGKRPQSITLQIKNKVTGKIVAEEIVKGNANTNEGWSHIFEVPKYDENAQKIEYEIEEKDASKYYEKEINQSRRTITNRFKILKSVVVKYIDKNTGKEIADAMTKEGIVGEEFDISGDKKDITGYTLIEEPEEKTGTYTDETQTKIYYYAKNTKVIVKYLEKETNKILTPDAQYEANGYEGQEYKTEQKEIDGYTLIENTKNTEGTMAREAIEVIYYYAKNTKVIVKYIDKETGGAVTPEAQYEQIGYVGKNYEVEAKDIEGYTLIENTNNTKGTMTKEEIEVIYYYAKNTKVIVKYLEKDNTPDNIEDNIILASQEEIGGYVGKEYKTEKKDIENYTFVESTNNTEGNMTRDTIEVIYYYAQNTRATVQHIDRETGKILKQETTEGKVGDILKTNAEDFEGYVLVQSPEKTDIVMEKDEQIVKYYYAHISAGIIEKHIDDITGELLYSEEHKGNEGDRYMIPAKTIEGYDLATEDKEGNSKLPTNAEGKMTKEVIEVKYYYTKKASVKVEYIDKLTGEKLTEDVIINGHEEEDYETEQKDFENYELIKVPENATGKMEVTKNEDGTYKKETLVQYYYIKKSAGVIEKHIDISSNKVLAQETHSGKVGDEYNIPAREFNWYELVEKDKEGNSKLPTNSKGNMKEELIEVDYYYIRKAKVTVEYIDKQTGEKLDTEEIVGYEGDKYETEDKKFDNYDLIEIPSNKTGEIKDKDIQVKYYYTRRAEVEVQYLEKDSKNILAESENISGHVGDEYETKTKDIQYYKFVESTTNTKGSMEKDKITVIYYYEKQVFDLKVDKWISNVTMDGIVQGGKTISTKDELYKLDIHRNKTTTANVRITYKMRVSNVGEIEGKVDKLTEVIPTGYSFHQEDNKIQWESNSGILITTVLKDKTIKPGENQEIEITLRWNKGEDNFGQKENIVILSQISNPAGYKDIHKEDNISKASMLITVATGIDRNDKIVIIVTIQILLAISVGLLVSYKKKEK